MKTKPRSPQPSAIKKAEYDGRNRDVMTLAETSTYLRLSEPDVLRLVREQDLPGRFVGADWRFLKSAIEAWLSQPPPRPSKEARLAVAGSWKDDPQVEEELKETYKRRGRPIASEAS